MAAIEQYTFSINLLVEGEKTVFMPELISHKDKHIVGLLTRTNLPEGSTKKNVVGRVLVDDDFAQSAFINIKRDSTNILEATPLEYFKIDQKQAGKMYRDVEIHGFTPSMSSIIIPNGVQSGQVGQSVEITIFYYN